MLLCSLRFEELHADMIGSPCMLYIVCSAAASLVVYDRLRDTTEGASLF